MGKPFIQDEISIELTEQSIIDYDKVRVTVGITAQIDADEGEDAFRKRIKDTLISFIDTEWRLSRLMRSRTTTSRLETATLTASARVPEKENYQLDNRIAELSERGLEFSSPQVDYSPPISKIQEVYGELRLRLLEKAKKEAVEINKSLGGMNYRISSVIFTETGGGNVSNRITSFSGMSVASAPAASSSTVEFSVSTDIVLCARVILRNLHKT